MKNPSLKTLENKLDKVFQTYIRKRAADEGGTVECVTCRKLMHWEGDGAQAGHFIKRQHRSVRWRETNCHVQCVRCNGFKGGMQDEYAKFIIQTYGLAEFEDLMKSKHQVTHWTRLDLEEKVNFYTDKLRNLPS